MHPIPLIQLDPELKPFEQQIINRIEWYQNTKSYILKHFKSLDRFANAHHFFGFQYDDEKKGWWFREWLPNAYYVSLIGDFNNWDREANPLKRGNFGAWEIFLADAEYKKSLISGSKIKIHVHGDNGKLDRIPAYIRQTIQNEDNSFDGVFTGFSNYKWKNKKPKGGKPKNPLIYEAHIGMATEDEKVGTYNEFTKNILPRIKKLGYNCVQLMAIQEHPYYGSFGYQVSNFYAPSSRFGSPDDLRKLIDTAHGMGISVILDVVHSHAVKNRDEGLTELDGTEQYFCGWHPDWDSRLFNYQRIEVKRFLVSNLKYWIEEFNFDGFRFDGVTSMLYNHFGHVEFNNYDNYFKNTNNDAIIYLQLANELIHELNPKIISICEDMSGMPGACRPVEEGGLGFDYRLAMGLPDFWFKLLENAKDEDWHMGELFWQLTNRRKKEKTIAYAESHDQALVGDKTMAFWLMDEEMYEGMSVFSENIIVDRGIALHKLIRFATATLGGEGYMNFMGNEFGHPEWIDFPREGNQWSYAYARRQWSLADTEHLKYKFLQKFDQEMISFISENKILSLKKAQKIKEDNEKGILSYRKGDFVFLFNFSKESYPNCNLTLPNYKKYKVVFDSDLIEMGGQNRVSRELTYKTNSGEVKIYLPCRSLIVLKDKI